MSIKIYIYKTKWITLSVFLKFNILVKTVLWAVLRQISIFLRGYISFGAGEGKRILHSILIIYVLQLFYGKIYWNIIICHFQNIQGNYE